jgi:ATP-dependent RNA helicase DDX51/DBP6
LLTQCQKLLFSATLTRDPATIATLGLRNPEYYIHGTEDVTEQYALPSTLEQKMTVIASADKPLALLHLIYGQKLHRALVFCKSIDAANRLSHLLKFFSDAWLEDRVSIAAYTAESDKKTLDEFSKGALDM